MLSRDLLFFGLVIISLWHIIHLGYSQPIDSVSITAFPTTTPCYGDIVILVCHHPQLAHDHRSRDEYLSILHWNESGTSINPAVESDIYMATTSSDLKYTNLTINITIDHFGKKVVKYFCEILPKSRGVPKSTDVSEEVTINPIEPPKLDIIVCFTAKNLSWEHSEGQPHCYDKILYYNVSWENRDNSSDIGWNTTTDEFYDISQLQRRNNYTITVKSMVGNISGEQDSIDIESGTPFVHCVDVPCYNNSFLMTCNTSRYTENVVIYNWLQGDENISNCSYTKDSHFVTNDCSVLIIRNVSPNTAGEYHCNVKDENGRILQGDPHVVDPPEIPLEPEVNYTIDGDQIFFNWTHNAACFNYTFNFSIEWEIVEDASFHANITSKMQYIIPGIPTRTYNVCIQAVNDEYALNGSLSCHIIYLARGKGPDSGNTELFALFILVIIIIAIPIYIIVIVRVLVCEKTKKGDSCSTDRTNPSKQELEEEPRAFQRKTERTTPCDQELPQDPNAVQRETERTTPCDQELPQDPNAVQRKTERTTPCDQELPQDPNAVQRKPAETINPYKQEPKKHPASHKKLQMKVSDV